MNGCTNPSNSILLFENCSSGGGGGGIPGSPGEPDCPNVSNLFSTGDECRDGIFQNTSTGYIPGSINWNFGDQASGLNNISTLEEPGHIYENVGTYDVTLTVTAQTGCTATITKPITVLPPPDGILDVVPSPEATIKVTEYNEFGQPADCFFDGYILCEGEDFF
ncbi:MAG: hypothetical protein ACI8YQ_004634 [Polaribacter sp.]